MILSNQVKKTIEEYSLSNLKSIGTIRRNRRRQRRTKRPIHLPYSWSIGCTTL